MIQIKPISDLRNKFTDIEKIVNEGEPVYLTKNGYGSMVVMSIETYSKLTEKTANHYLMEADIAASLNDTRMAPDEVLSGISRRIDGYRQ